MSNLGDTLRVREQGAPLGWRGLVFGDYNYLIFR